uniref:Uncharacterized protein n=1 Tax=Moniliophthora roreri TaxID=221103 RepID=A0A0W0FYY5_MONRR
MASHPTIGISHEKETSLSALYNDIDETDLATHTLQGNLWPNSIDLKIVPRIPMPRYLTGTIVSPNTQLVPFKDCLQIPIPLDNVYPAQTLPVPDSREQPNLNPSPSPLGSHYHAGKGTLVLNQTSIDSAFVVMTYPGRKKH